MAGNASRDAFAFGLASRDENARVKLQALCDRLGRRAGVLLYPHIAPSYARLTEDVKAGTVGIAWAPPLVALELTRARTALLVACARRERGTSFHSAIFARRGLGLRSVADLEGKHMAWVDPESVAGYVVPRLFVRQTGIDPEQFFGKETFFRSHAAVVRAVLYGSADAGATHAGLDVASGRVVEAGWVEEAHVALDAVDLIGTAGPIPTDTIVVSSAISADKKDALSSGLLDADELMKTLIRALFRAEGFQRASADHLAPLERLMSRAPRKRRA